MLVTAASNVRNKKYFFILAFLPIKMPSFLPEIQVPRRLEVAPQHAL